MDSLPTFAVSGPHSQTADIGRLMAGLEDLTFTMDAFWADLGVDAPPPSVKRGDLRQASSFASTECEQENEWDL